MNTLLRRTGFKKLGLWTAGLLLLVLALPGVYASAIHDAAESGDVDTVRSILDQNPRAWDTDDHYSHDSPVGLAVANSQIEVFKLFIANGYPITGDNGEWSYHVRNRNEEFEELPLTERQRDFLVWGLEQGTDFTGNWYGSTLIDMVRANDLESAELLLAVGVDASSESGDKSALDYAQSDEMRALLTGYGATSLKAERLKWRIINLLTLFVPLILLWSGFIYITGRLLRGKSARLLSLVGGLALIAAVLMWISGGTVGRQLRFDIGESMAMIVTAVFFKLVPILIIGRALSLVKRSIQIQATSADEILKKDTRSPILYLRSFQNDASYRKRRWWYWLALWFAPMAAVVPRSSHEQELTGSLQKYGPVVAIGDPDEELPKLGAHRLYVGHDSWKETVLDLMEKSELIVLRIGLTEGILWELQNAIDRLQPKKFVIWIVPGKGNNVDEAEKLANHLHEKSAGILPQAIPLDICRSEFIYFSEGWTPHPAKRMKDVVKVLGLEPKKSGTPVAEPDVTPG